MERERLPAHGSPMADFCASQVEKRAESAAPQSGNGRRILVVEDDCNIRRLNVAVLRKAGYHAEGAADGALAWSALKSAAYDLVITDNDMPKVTGVELMGKIQDANMSLPVIMASGSFPEDEFSRSRLPRPAATLLKPYDFVELIGAVKEVLDRAINNASDAEERTQMNT